MGSLATFSGLVNLQGLVYNGIDTFVETGCFQGNSIGFAINLGFKKIYSCDIDINCVNQCVSRFSGHPGRVTIEHASSAQFLDKLLPTLDDKESIVFYLDAHLPDEPSTNDIMLPLENEMDIIWKYRKDKKDHIIIDDWRIYEENSFTGGNWVDREKYGNPNLNFLLKYNYHVGKHLNDEGYLYLTKHEFVEG